MRLTRKKRSILSSGLWRLARRLSRHAGVGSGAQQGTAVTSAQYWSTYHVDAPEVGFASVEASLNHFDWRNRMYPGYLELMPVDQADGLVVLDYGCGPGNDVIGFGHFSKPAKIVALDVSAISLELTRKRAALHGIAVETRLVRESPLQLPLANASVDLVHCSGVLHHTPDPGAILSEFARILKPEGFGQIMVYNYDSIWMHLYTAYQKTLVEGLFQGMSKRRAFEQTMDGEGCPIAACYTVDEFTALAQSAGLGCKYLGTSMSTLELRLLGKRFDALDNIKLDPESRRFLSELSFDEHQWPLHRNRVAGVNACFRVHRSI